MGRKTRRKLLRVRYQEKDRSIKSRLVFNCSSKSAGDIFGQHKVLRVSKISEEERLKVGDFSQLGALERELIASNPDPSLRNIRPGRRRGLVIS